MNINELLGNEKIKEFFGCKHTNKHECHNQDEETAYQILEAMTVEIRKGDKCLWLGNSIEVIDAGNHITDFPRMWLRLPEQLQPQRETCECCCHAEDCKHLNCCRCFDPKPSDPVEEKIEMLADEYRGVAFYDDHPKFLNRMEFHKHLVELVALARRTQ